MTEIKRRRPEEEFDDPLLDDGDELDDLDDLDDVDDLADDRDGPPGYDHAAEDLYGDDQDDY